MLKSQYGLISTPSYGADELIKGCLAMYGEWGYVEAMIASTLVTRGDSVWDIGAHLGTFSLGLAQNSDVGYILALEANLKLISDLKTNLSRNLNVKFSTVHAGVADCSGRGSILVDDPSNQGAARFVLIDDNEPSTINDTLSVTLKQLRAQHGDYDFLKLDIEGGEVAALQGDADFIRSWKPVIWAECNESEQSFKLLDQMLTLGYTPYYVAFPVIRSEKRKMLRQVIYPMAYEASLVCGVPERLNSLDVAVTSEPCISRKINSHQDLQQALWDTPRWARQEWVELSKPELIARMGHFERGDDFDTFTGFAVAKSETKVFAEKGTFSTGSKSGATAIAQVFWAHREAARYEFSERDSQIADISIDGATRVLSFLLPSEFGPLHVRVDPIDRQSVVSLGAIKLVNGAGDVRWYWDGDLGEVLNMSGMVALTASDTLSYVCVNTDPHFEISIPDGVFDYGGGLVKLIIEIKAESLEMGLGRLFEVVDCKNDKKPSISLGNSIGSLANVIGGDLDNRDQTIAQQCHQLNSMRIELLRAEAQLGLLKDLMIGIRDEGRL